MNCELKYTPLSLSRMLLNTPVAVPSSDRLPKDGAFMRNFVPDEASVKTRCGVLGLSGGRVIFVRVEFASTTQDGKNSFFSIFMPGLAPAVHVPSHHSGRMLESGRKTVPPS